ncbi:MAG: hypothetical protein JST18_10180 [Bacteroidetes bacterium]|nr:hypothetical protein [Bacteroidota bacterium]
MKTVTIFALWAFLFLAEKDNISYAQTISTIAGTGVAGYNGDGIAATAAQLNYPAGIGVDASGNVYVTDMLNACIRKIDNSTGVISTIAGVPGTSTGFFSGNGGLATAATFSWYALGAIPHSSGNIYIADAGSNIICKVTASTGIISIIAGVNGSSGSTGDGGAATSAKLNYPVAMAFDAAGNNLYIADCYNHKIRKVNISTGIITTVAGTGAAGSSGDGGAATSAKLNYPAGVAVDGAGNVYIGDGMNNKIRKVTAATGVISTFAGTGVAGLSGDGGAATSAKLNAPQGLAIDASGNVYFADQANHRIRKVTAATGAITTVAGTSMGFSGDGGPATSAKMNSPWSLAIQAGCNLIISDQVNQRVRKVACLQLPVELTSFNGKQEGSTNVLTWETSSELNNDYFSIERSVDGNTFYEIGRLKGAGNSTSLNEYVFYDEYPGEGTNYYRLKQIDTDGSFEYSNAIAIDGANSFDPVSIYPAGNNLFILHFYNSFDGEIMLSDIRGNVLLRTQGSGRNEIPIDLRNFSPGIYLLDLNDRQMHRSLKLFNY